MNQRLQAVDPQPEQGACALHGARRSFEFIGPWFRFDEAAAYVRCLHRCGCPSAKGFYDWRTSRGVIAHGNVVAKADLDRVLRHSANGTALRAVVQR